MDPKLISKLQVVNKDLIETCVREEIRAGQIEPEEGERRAQEPFALESIDSLKMSFKRQCVIHSW